MGNYQPHFVEMMSKQIPMKRMGTVEEVAELALFLAHSKYITGETVYIDGGNRLWGDKWQID